MVTSTQNEELPSLLRTTTLRSITLGRTYIIAGLAYVIVLTLVLGSEGRSSFESAIPLLLPIFGVLGSLGALTAFTNDRIKGVFEYLIAYGVTPRALFTNFLVAGLLTVTLVLGITLPLVLGASLAFFGSISWYFVGLLALYSLPMCYASAGFASQVGMYFTALSSPRGGMNSPLGIIPLVGMAPSLVTLIAVGVVGSAFGTGAILVVLVVALLAIAVMVGTLLALVGRLVRHERFLSPA